jgi:hypothetical protein
MLVGYSMLPGLQSYSDFCNADHPFFYRLRSEWKWPLGMFRAREACTRPTDEPPFSVGAMTEYESHQSIFAIPSKQAPCMKSATTSLVIQTLQ